MSKNIVETVEVEVEVRLAKNVRSISNVDREVKNSK